MSDGWFSGVIDGAVLILLAAEAGRRQAPIARAMLRLAAGAALALAVIG